MLFSFCRNKPGIEPGHLRAMYPEDVIRNTIGQVGSTISVVNEVLFIHHSILTLHLCAIYKIYNTHKIYLQYILHIKYIIHI